MVDKDEKNININDENDLQTFEDFEDYYGLKDDEREKELDFN